MSDAIWKHEFVSEYKAVDCPRTNKNDYTQETFATFVPEYRHCALILGWVLY